MSDIEKDARRFLRRMIRVGGFIADGIYEEHPRFWKSTNKHSTALMDLGVFGFLKRQGYIRRDSQGRYLVTPSGRRFAMPWYKRIFF